MSLEFHVHIVRDAHGNVIERTEELRDVDLTEHLANVDQQAITEANDAIKAQLRDADIANLRALYEGDAARIKAHAASQAELRKKLR